MPFKSEKQRRYLWMHEPEVARKWSEKYGSTPVSNKSRASALKHDNKGRKS